MNLSLAHLAGILLVLAVIILASYLSGRRVRSAADFSTGGRSSSPLVAGAIMGTLVGGSSTVGTAQLAYSCGMSAWWFTLGAGLGCLALALAYVRPLRASGCTTLVGIVGREYGRTADMLASGLSSLGMFINIISQLLSAVAVIAVIFPRFGQWPALLFAAALMTAYVVFGGVLSASLVGMIKLLLLYAAVAVGAVLALSLSGGFAALNAQLDPGESWNLFYRGVGKDAGAGLALILGVITTQSYAQAVFSGRSDKAARQGALISAVMIPPIGIGGILIGLYMRVNYPELPARLAFPQFVIDFLPGLPAGMVLATLLIAVVGTGAGLALGISSIVSKDILPNLRRFGSWPERAAGSLAFNRGCIVTVLLLACCLSTGALGDVILNFAFMSMGLRGAVIFVPLTCALWLSGKIDRFWMTAAILIGPLLVLICGLLPGLEIDPLFPGILASAVLAAIGFLKGRKSSFRL